MTGDRIVWRCERCGRAIADSTGYVTIDHAAVASAHNAQRHWDDTHRGRPIGGDELLTYPDPVHWEVLHEACDPHIERDDYWFDVARCRTIAELLDWNTHLHCKQWCDASDWDEFIQRHVR